MTARGEESGEKGGGPHAGGGGVAAAVLLLVVAGLFSLGSAAEGPAELNSDYALLCGYVARAESPERFARDGLLGEEGKFAHYPPLYLAILRVAVSVSGGETRAVRLLSFPVVASFLLGAWCLGRRLLRSAWGAIAFALLSLPMSWVYPIEFWGFGGSYTVLARSLYTACLPWALCLWWDTLGQRGAVLASLLVGLVANLHPPGGLAWMAATTIGSALVKWRVEPARAALRCLLAAAVAAMVGFSPYLAHWAAWSEKGAVSPERYDEAYEAMSYRATAAYLDVPGTSWRLLKHLGRQVWPWTALLLLLAPASGWRGNRALRALVGCALGLLFATMAVPWAEQLVARHLHRLPPELALTRGVRYLRWLLLLLAVWGVVVWLRRVRALRAERPRAGLALAIAGLAWLCWAVPRFVERCSIQPLVQGAAALASGRLVPEMSAESREAEALLAEVRALPEGVAFLSDSRGLLLRGLAHRPVVFDRKDAGGLTHSRPLALIAWHRTALADERARREGPTALAAFARGLGADYVVDSSWPHPDRGEGYEVVFRNGFGVIVRLAGR